MKPKRLPPLTREQTRRALDQLQALYGDKALPKVPPASDVEKPEPEPPATGSQG